MQHSQLLSAVSPAQPTTYLANVLRLQYEASFAFRRLFFQRLLRVTPDRTLWLLQGPAILFSLLSALQRT